MFIFSSTTAHTKDVKLLRLIVPIVAKFLNICLIPQLLTTHIVTGTSNSFNIYDNQFKHFRFPVIALLIWFLMFRLLYSTLPIFPNYIRFCVIRVYMLSCFLSTAESILRHFHVIDGDCLNHCLWVRRMFSTFFTFYELAIYDA